MTAPFYQGKLDGLCEPYAIVNAFGKCGVAGSEALFEAACSAPAESRWPSLLWDGTTLGDLKLMIKRCKDTVPGADTVKVSYPFSRNTPRTNEMYWRRFDKLFEERPLIRCMIVGLWRPSLHWIVATKETAGHVSFVDTDPHNPFQRKRRSSLHAGERNANLHKWIIERSELILFEVAE